MVGALLLLKVALDGVVGARADAALVRLVKGPPDDLIEQAADLVARTTGLLGMKKRDWKQLLGRQETWQVIATVAGELVADPDATPASLWKLVGLFPKVAERASQEDRVDAAAFLVLAVLAYATPELRASLAVVPSVGDAFRRQEESVRRRAEAAQRRRLPLKAATLRRSDRALSPAGVLVAQYGVVPFLDRGGFLGRLQRWCVSPERCAVAVATGEGGAGKTRLASELCRTVSRRQVGAGP